MKRQIHGLAATLMATALGIACGFSNCCVTGLQAAPPAQADAAAPSVRTWTDATGVFSVEAALVAVKDGQAHLRKSDGRLVTVPLDKLSDKDRRYIEQHLRETGQAKAPPVDRRYVHEVLPTRTDYDFVETPLPDVLEFLSKLHDVPIVVDAVALPRQDAANLTVTSKGRSQPLAAALDQILKPLELDWFAADGAVLVTARTKAESYFEPRVYRIVAKPFVFDDVIDNVTSTIAPGTWADVGGGGEIAPLLPRTIVVRQTPAVHRQIAEAFGELVEAVYGPPAAGPSRNNAAVAQTAACQFGQTPLAEAAAQLADRAGVEVVLAAGVNGQTPVSLRLPELPLAQVLSILLWPHDLTWTSTPQRITISRQDAITPRVVTYKIAGLDRTRGHASLIDVIESTIEPAAWDHVGGAGVIRAGARTGTIVVRQPEPVQRQIDQLLADLHTARQP